MNLLTHKRLRLILLLALFALAVALRLRQPLSYAGAAEIKPAMASLPHVMLWAWERPEKLDFIDPQSVGVAFLSKTIDLRGSKISVRPRLQQLTVPTGTKLVAVVRIQSNLRDNSPLSAEQRDQVMREIIQVANLADVSAIQIDFDARFSERNFYSSLLFQLRKTLPETMPLSITALASWCAGDKWLSELPVDEAVPMLFRMGVDSSQFTTRLASGEDPFGGPCDAAAGYSIDERVAPLRRQRVYIFSPESWSPESVKAALETYR